MATGNGSQMRVSGNLAMVSEFSTFLPYFVRIYSPPLFPSNKRRMSVNIYSEEFRPTSSSSRR
jgi:hypothetical protein